MKLSAEEATDIVHGKLVEWTRVWQGFIKHKRWQVVFEDTYQHDGKYYAVTVPWPATEMQEGQEMFYGEVEFTEVRQTEKTVTDWVPVETEGE